MRAEYENRLCADFSDRTFEQFIAHEIGSDATAPRYSADEELRKGVAPHPALARSGTTSQAASSDGLPLLPVINREIIGERQQACFDRAPHEPKVA
jgi:hypothetical protein